MTNQEQLNKQVNERIDIYNILQKESTAVQIAIEYEETLKAEMCINWLEDMNSKKQNPMITDLINIVKMRFKKHSKLVSDLKHYEAKCTYLESLNDSVKMYRETISILDSKMEELKQLRLQKQLDNF